MEAMAPFADLTTLCAQLVGTASRLGKRRLVAEYLRGLAPQDVGHAVAFLTGRPFSVSDARVLNVRGLPAASSGPASGPALTIADVAEAFAEVARASGAGARRRKEQRLSALAARASDA